MTLRRVTLVLILCLLSSAGVAAVPAGPPPTPPEGAPLPAAADGVWRQLALDVTERRRELEDEAQRLRQVLTLAAVSDHRRRILEREVAEIDAERARLPYVAVVLSGGGATNSWQVGVMHALEKSLVQYNQTVHPRERLRIGLLVGTSAGAMNALPFALAPGNRELHEALWQDVRMSRVMRMPEATKPRLSLWDPRVVTVTAFLAYPWLMFVVLILVALLMLWLLCGIAHAWYQSEERILWEPGILASAVVIVLLFYNRLVGKVLLGVTLAIFVSFAFIQAWRDPHRARLLTYNRVVEVVRQSRRIFVRPAATPEERKARLRETSRALRWAAGAMLAAVFFAAVTVGMGVGILFREEALFSNKPLAATLSRSYARLIPGAAQRDLNPQTTSVAIWESVREGRVERDFIMTAADYKKERELYFISFRDDDRRSVQTKLTELRQAVARELPAPVIAPFSHNTDMLLEFVLASGAVFPVFPPTFELMLETYERTDTMPKERPYNLIDGGLFHNVPVAAAVNAGATHLIVVDIHPDPGESPPVRREFVSTAASAIGTLLERGQTRDLAARRTVWLASIRPQTRVVGLLDFDKPMKPWIAQGYTDATSGRRFYIFRRPGF